LIWRNVKGDLLVSDAGVRRGLPMRCVIVGLAVLLGGVPALAQTAGGASQGDARQGAALARDWCSSCHVVGTEPGARGTDAVPSFVSVARDPAKGPDYVRRVLANPHPPMPQMPLSRRSVEDLVAYFRTLVRP
jgi:mono/diheme cytochrome c family protein